LTKADDSSIINILPTRIDAISHSTCGQVILRLVMGETILLSCISMSSLKRLNLRVGDSVFAQIKAVAVLT
jgi:molybdate transport system ATP-binding protein